MNSWPSALSSTQSGSQPLGRIVNRAGSEETEGKPTWMGNEWGKRRKAEGFARGSPDPRYGPELAEDKLLPSDLSASALPGLIRGTERPAETTGPYRSGSAGIWPYGGVLRVPRSPFSSVWFWLSLCVSNPPFPLVTCTCFPALLNLSFHRLCVPRNALSYLPGGCWSQLEYTELINPSSSPIFPTPEGPPAAQS